MEGINKLLTKLAIFHLGGFMLIVTIAMVVDYSPDTGYSLLGLDGFMSVFRYAVGIISGLVGIQCIRIITSK